MYEVPQSQKSVKKNRFVFRLNGETYDMPLLKFAPLAAAELLEQGKEVAALLMLCETDEARTAIRSLDGEQFGALAAAWAEASGVSPGELGASPTS